MSDTQETIDQWRDQMYASYVEEGGPMKVGWRDRLADWIESVAVGIAERIRPQRPWEGYGLNDWVDRNASRMTFMDDADLIDNDPLEWEEVLVDDEA